MVLYRRALSSRMPPVFSLVLITLYTLLHARVFLAQEMVCSSEACIHGLAALVVIRAPHYDEFACDPEHGAWTAAFSLLLPLAGVVASYKRYGAGLPRQNSFRGYVDGFIGHYMHVFAVNNSKQ